MSVASWGALKVGQWGKRFEESLSEVMTADRKVDWLEFQQATLWDMMWVVPRAASRAQSSADQRVSSKA